jgi:hypothetical protein
VGRLEQAINRLDQAVARLESASATVLGKAAAPREAAATHPPADVAARIDAVINRLDRVLEG